MVEVSQATCVDFWEQKHRGEVLKEYIAAADIVDTGGGVHVSNFQQLEQLADNLPAGQRECDSFCFEK